MPVQSYDEFWPHYLREHLPPVAGALSLATLEHVPFTLDLGHDQLTFETADSLRARTATASRATIRLSRGLGGAIAPLVYDGNIGADLIERLVLTFDLAHAAMWAARVPPEAVAPSTPRP